MWEASRLKAGSQTPAPVLSALQLCDRGRATLRSFYIKLLTLSGKLKYICVMSQPFSQEDTVMLSPSVSAGRQQRQRPEARLKWGAAGLQDGGAPGLGPRRPLLCPAAFCPGSPVFVNRSISLAHCLSPRCHCCSVARLCLSLCNPRTAARQASLSFTVSQSLLKLLAVELVMSSNHLILCQLLLLLPSIFPSIRVFSNELALCIRWPKDWSFTRHILVLFLPV